MLAWDFTQHFMCKDYDVDVQPIGQTNVFSPDDARAVALNHFEYQAQEIDVRTEFYGPSGALYSTGDYTLDFDLAQHHWYGWRRHARSMSINGFAPQYICGDWTVKFYVKRPISGSWQQR